MFSLLLKDLISDFIFDNCVYISAVRRSTGTKRPSSSTTQLQQHNEQPNSHFSYGRNKRINHLKNKNYSTNHYQDKNHNWYSNSDNHKSHHNQEEDLTYESQYYNHSTPVQRCCKCGLTNHTTADCRHRRQLLCHECNFYGHKDSVCWNV